MTFLIPLAGGVLILAGGRIVRRPRVWPPLAFLTLALAAAFRAGLMGDIRPSPAPSGAWLVNDPLTAAAEWLAIGLGALLVLLAGSGGSRTEHPADPFGLTLISVAGLMLAASANDLVLAFAAVELVSFSTIVAAWCSRRKALTSDAALETLVPAVLSSLVLLLGLTLIYGLTNSTNLAGIRAVLAASYTPHDTNLAVGRGSGLGVTAVVLVFAGLGRRLAAVPFHFGLVEAWSRQDQSSLLAVTVGRATAFVVLVRVVVESLPGFEEPARLAASLLAGLTLVVAGVRALSRSDARRMAADLIVLQSGFLLMGLAAALAMPAAAIDSSGAGGAPNGVAAAFWFLVLSLTATLGLLGVLHSLEDSRGGVRTLDDLAGLAQTHPVAAACLVLCLLALAGVPPLAGFWGRWFLVLAALTAPAEATAAGAIGLDAGFVALTFAAALGTLLAGAAAVRWLEPVLLVGPLGRPRRRGRYAAAAAVCAALALAAATLLPDRTSRLFEDVGTRGRAAATDSGDGRAVRF
ncbi:MAG TPA: proton-conducting transporter membrane subunit [Planctomycetaceae bacterium]|nr:proton-conducting transporter membrane subunit [Planctomycetaceae bacterium]